MNRILMLALGGALGTLARYVVNGLVSARLGGLGALTAVFPLGTVVVNVSGCLVIGLLAAVAEPSLGRAWLRPEWRDFLLIGLCGGYTTFSSYALQTLNLARDAEWMWAFLNVAASNVLCLAAVFLGRAAGLLLQARFHGGAL
jgi:CrcB protein